MERTNFQVLTESVFWWREADSVIKESSGGVAKKRGKAEKEGRGAQGRGVALERRLEGSLSEKVTLEWRPEEVREQVTWVFGGSVVHSRGSDNQKALRLDPSGAFKAAGVAGTAGERGRL